MGRITVASSGVTREIIVTQAAQTVVPRLTVDIAATPVSLGSGSVTLIAGVDSNVSWTVSSNVNWLNASVSSGTNGGSFSIFVDSNMGGGRSGAVTVRGTGNNSNLTQTINVTQAAAPQPPTLNVDGTDMHLPAVNGVLSRRVESSNVTWSATVGQGGQGWLSVTPQSGSSSGFITMIAQNNTTGWQRSAVVTVAGSGSGVWPQSFMVIQSAGVQTTGRPDPRTAVAVTHNSITVNATNAPMGWTTQYRIRLANHNVWSEWQTSNVFTNLEPLRGYQFQARFTANNTATHEHSAESLASATISTTAMPQTVVAPTVRTDQESGVTQTAARLHGNITSLGGAAALEHGFHFGTSPTLATFTTLALEASATGGTFNWDVTGLAPNTQYFFRAYARNSAGTGQGSILNFRTTANNQPAPTPMLTVQSTANLAATAGSNAAITVTSNTTWSVSASSQGWLTVTNITPANRTGNGSFRITAEANPGTQARTAVVTVTATGVAPRTLTVTQVGVVQQQNVNVTFNPAGGAIVPHPMVNLIPILGSNFSMLALAMMQAIGVLINLIIPRRVTIFFDPAGGTFERNSFSMPPGTRLGNTDLGNLLNANSNPVREGFNFIGWFTEYNGAGDLVTTGMAMNYSGTIFAHWIPQRSNTRVDFEPVRGNVIPGSLTTNTDGKLEMLPTPYGGGEFNAFKGWYTSVNGGEEVTTDTVFTENATIYAHWETTSDVFSADVKVAGAKFVFSTRTLRNAPRKSISEVNKARVAVKGTHFSVSTRRLEAIK